MQMNVPVPANARERLIVALDFDTKAQANELIERIGDSVQFYKVGWQLFIREGMTFVDALLKRNKKVFLDLKMDDIEETIRSALNNLPHAGLGGIELLTIHGNGQTAKAARNGRNGKVKPFLLVLTALSSQDDTDMKDLFNDEKMTRQVYVSWKARRALEAGCEGLIASGASIRQLREELTTEFGHFLIVAPGIRPTGVSGDDHKNLMTPYDAIVEGADYLVMGRPIRNAPDPKAAADAAVADIERALHDRLGNGTPLRKSA